MKITHQEDRVLGSTVTGFKLDKARESDFADLRAAVCTEKILLIEDLGLNPAQLVEFGQALGTIDVYYEPMYHHPEHREIFVSASKPAEGTQVGVPRTGLFWHADYSFMPKPFGITVIAPQVVPQRNRGTYFIDMGKVFAGLPDDLRTRAAATHALHSPRRYFKIRPSDVYRPICELQDEIEKSTPPSIHPTVFRHPVTGEDVLYVSQGLTCELHDENGRVLDDGLLELLLERSGQADPTFAHPNIHTQTFSAGDLLVWDNRSLVHRALHAAKPEPTVSYRVTVHDEHPFYPGIGA